MKKSVKSRRKKKKQKYNRLVSMSKRVRPYTKKDMYEDMYKGITAGMRKLMEIEEEKKKLEKAEKLRLRELRKEKLKQLVSLRIA